MIGAQASNDQLEKILSYLDIGKQEGAKVLTGGKRAKLDGELAEGYYVEPTIFAGNNKMRIFQEEIFGPVVLGHEIQGRERCAFDRQRHAVWPRRRRLDPQRQPRPPVRPGDPGWSGLDQLLPRLSRARGLWRVQAIRHRA
jgi:Aldehyde dehydrogenase family